MLQAAFEIPKAQAVANFVERQPTTLARLRSDMLLSSAGGELDSLLQASAKRLFQQKYRLAGPRHDVDAVERTSLLADHDCSCGLYEHF